jgi:hypothetical protein
MLGVLALGGHKKARRGRVQSAKFRELRFNLR